MLQTVIAYWPVAVLGLGFIAAAVRIRRDRRKMQRNCEALALHLFDQASAALADGEEGPARKLAFRLLRALDRVNGSRGGARDLMLLMVAEGMSAEELETLLELGREELERRLSGKV